jgi:cell shape-determining protein MreC
MKPLTDINFQKIIIGTLRSCFNDKRGTLHAKDIGSTSNRIVNQLNAALIQTGEREFKEKIEIRVKEDIEKTILDLQTENEKYKKENRRLREQLGLI